jgi:hypothetical protein
MELKAESLQKGFGDSVMAGTRGEVKGKKRV